MNKLYTVQPSDTLQDISSRFYGVSSKYQRIVNANPEIKNNNIFVGQVLIIPALIEKKTIPQKVEGSDKIGILIDNQLFELWDSFSIKFTLDTLDTFSIVAPFDPTDDIQRNAFRPFQYKDCALYLAGELIFNGTLMVTLPDLTENRSSINLGGVSKPVVLNDCTIPISLYPIEFKKQNLQQIASTIALAYNILVEFTDDPGPLFKKVGPRPDSKILSWLTGLAKQRGFLTSNTLIGKLLFRKIDLNLPPLAFIREGEAPLISCKPFFNSQNYFSHITGLTPQKKNARSTAYSVKVPGITALRTKTFIAKDTENQNLVSVVNNYAGRMVGSAATWNLIVQGLRAPNGELWRDGDLISVFAPSAYILRDTKFVIKQATLERGSDKGDITTLNLVLPEAYSDQAIGKLTGGIPWEG